MGQQWFIHPGILRDTSPYMTDDPETGSKHYVQIFQSIPALERFYFDWEKNFNVRWAFSQIRSHSWVPLVAVILYLSFLIEGKRYIDRRIKQGKGPVRLGKLPALWNLFLAVFSIWGAVRVVPHFLFLFTEYNFKETVCVAADKAGYGDGAAGLWVMLFTVSKLFELVDTVIIVLKGKEPIFLHWYHHVTVLLYTWFSYSRRNPGIYYIAMNYTVHAFMYSYYFLTEVKLWPKWLNPMFITIMQINQMFVGVAICIASAIYMRDSTCAVVPEMVPWCAAMYATYLYFFVEFFVQRFLLRSAGKSNPVKLPAEPKNGATNGVPNGAGSKHKEL